MKRHTSSVSPVTPADCIGKRHWKYISPVRRGPIPFFNVSEYAWCAQRRAPGLHHPAKAAAV